MSKSSKNDIRTKLKPLLFHDDWTVVHQGLQLFESLSVSEETFIEAFRSLNRKKIPKRVNYDFLLGIFEDAEYSAYLALTFLGLFAQYRGGDHIRKLEISQESLLQLPTSIGHFTQLRKLRLFDNELTSLPDEIANAQLLEVLTISENHLTAFPSHLEGLTNLKELCLSDNNLSELPDTIGGMTQLTDLDIVGSRLTALPESFVHLQNLT